MKPHHFLAALSAVGVLLALLHCQAHGQSVISGAMISGFSQGAAAAPGGPTLPIGYLISLSHTNLSGPDGQYTNRWLDSSGNNYYASNAIGTGYYPAVTNTVNGMGMWWASNANNGNVYLAIIDTVAKATLSSNAAGFTLATLFYYDVGTSNNGTVFYFSTGDAINKTRFSLSRSSTAEKMGISARRLDTDASTVFNTTNFATNVWYAAVAVMDWANQLASLYTNSVKAFSVANGLSAGNTSSTNCQYMRLGYHAVGTAYQFRGVICDMIMWPRALSEQEATNACAWLWANR